MEDITTVTRLPEPLPDRMHCETCRELKVAFDNARDAIRHSQLNYGHVVVMETIVTDLVVTGANAWVADTDALVHNAKSEADR